MRRSLWQIAGACLNTAALCCLVATLVFAVRDFAAEQVRQKEVVAMETLRETNRRTYYQRHPVKYLVGKEGTVWLATPPLPPWERAKSVAFIYHSTGTVPRPMPSPKAPRFEDLIDRAHRS